MNDPPPPQFCQDLISRYLNVKDEEMSRRQTKALIRIPLNKERSPVYGSLNEIIPEVTADTYFIDRNVITYSDRKLLLLNTISS